MGDDPVNLLADADHQILSLLWSSHFLQLCQIQTMCCIFVTQAPAQLHGNDLGMQIKCFTITLKLHEGQYDAWLLIDMGYIL